MPKDCLKDVIKERQEKRDKMVGGTVNSLKGKKKLDRNITFAAASPLLEGKCSEAVSPPGKHSISVGDSPTRF